MRTLNNIYKNYSKQNCDSVIKCQNINVYIKELREWIGSLDGNRNEVEQTKRHFN